MRAAPWVVALACAGCVHTGGGPWAGAFTPYPNARALCEDRVGSIAWRSYATTASPEDVARFYRSAHPRLVDESGKDVLTLEAPGERVLAVMNADRRAPSCTAASPEPGERTIIVVSESVRAR